MINDWSQQIAKPDHKKPSVTGRYSNAKYVNHCTKESGLAVDCKDMYSRSRRQSAVGGGEYKVLLLALFLFILGTGLGILTSRAVHVYQAIAHYDVRCVANVFFHPCRHGLELVKS